MIMNDSNMNNSVVFQLGRIKCRCYKADNDRVVYLLYPMESAEEWLAQAAGYFRLNIVAVSGMDWDNDMTPWPAPGVPAGSEDFKGEAPGFLKLLQEEVIPRAETVLGFRDGKPGGEGERRMVRDLIGVSLSGLFALWEWAVCDTFRNLAVLSGSFWYKSFPEWFSEHCPEKKEGEAYLLLGNRESDSPVPEFRKVGRATAEVVDILRSRGIKVEFESVPGNHYQYQLERLTKALSFLSNL